MKDNNEIISLKVSQSIIPGDLSFGIYGDNGGLQINSGYELDRVIISKDFPLIDKETALKAIVLEELKLSFDYDLLEGKSELVFDLDISIMGNKLQKLIVQEQSTKSLKNNTSNTTYQATQDDISWADVQKSAGPIYLSRVGIAYIEDNIKVLADVSLNVSALSIGLDGLSLQMPVFSLDSIQDLNIDLKGLDISFTTDSLSISGGLQKIKKPNVVGYEYDGFLSVKLSKMTIGALGSYSKLKVGNHDEDSLFIFAFVNSNIGGPPSFYVQGLALGFGYNKEVIVPTINQVSSFPLLAGLSNPSELGLSDSSTPKSSDLSNVLSKIDKHIVTKPKEYWFAGGIKFSTYEMLFSSAVVVLEVGKEFELFLVGMSYASLPSKSLEYAYIELALEVVVAIDKGFFKAEAQLTKNSFLLDKSCHLSGGFAFYLWFGENKHAGDFVFTIGGYHPSFTPPKHYPTVPRVGFNWNVSSDIVIKGKTYFALTQSSIMAGGSLEILFQSSNLRAWFDAYADILIFWKPFYFTASISVVLGISYHIGYGILSTTIKLEVGASLKLYGPPTGGDVHIHLPAISFTIAFGDNKPSSSTSINWDEFLTMLPKGDTQNIMQNNLQNSNNSIDISTISISSGLINQIENEDNTQRWIVRADELVLNFESQFPLSQIDFDNQSIKSNKKLNIRPMSKSITASIAKVTIYSKSSNKIKWKQGIKLNRHMPTGLWGSLIDDPSNIDSNDTLVKDCLIGLDSISPDVDYNFGNTNVIDTSVAFSNVPIFLDNQTLPKLILSNTTKEIISDAKSIDDSINSIIEKGLIEKSSSRKNILNTMINNLNIDLEQEDMDDFLAHKNFIGEPLIGQIAV
jgi:hypothetical protein